MRNVHLTSFAVLLAIALASSAALAGGKHDGDRGNSGNHGGPPSDNMPPDSGGPGNAANAPGHGVKLQPPATSATCSADDSSLTGPDGQAGSSHVAHTNFGPLDATTGEPVASPDLGRMMYFWIGSTFDFVLNAHGLPAVQDWTLTYQPEPLPSPGVICLAHGIVNAGGQLHLAGSVELNSNLPPALDPFATDPATAAPDALLALVPSTDVDCMAGTMTAFHPEDYRFSSPRVRFVDSDLLPAVQAPPAGG